MRGREHTCYIRVVVVECEGAKPNKFTSRLKNISSQCARDLFESPLSLSYTRRRSYRVYTTLSSHTRQNPFLCDSEYKRGKNGVKHRLIWRVNRRRVPNSHFPVSDSFKLKPSLFLLFLFSFVQYHSPGTTRGNKENLEKTFHATNTLIREKRVGTKGSLKWATIYSFMMTWSHIRFKKK